MRSLDLDPRLEKTQNLVSTNVPEVIESFKASCNGNGIVMTVERPNVLNVSCLESSTGSKGTRGSREAAYLTPLSQRPCNIYIQTEVSRKSAQSVFQRGNRRTARTSTANMHRGLRTCLNDSGSPVPVRNLETLRKRSADGGCCVLWDLRNVTDPKVTGSATLLAGSPCLTK